MRAKRGQRFQRALRYLKALQHQDIEPDVISHSAAISACEKGQRCQQDLRILRVMQHHDIVPAATTYNAATSACGKKGQQGQQCQLGIVPNVITCSAAIRVRKGAAHRRDLHPLRAVQYHDSGRNLHRGCFLQVQELLRLDVAPPPPPWIGDGRQRGDEAHVARTLWRIQLELLP